MDRAAGEVIAKLVNATGKDARTTVDLSGVRHIYGGTLTVLQADDAEAVNTFGAPSQVAPRETTFSPESPKFDLTLPANSFTVIRLGVAR